MAHTTTPVATVRSLLLLASTPTVSPEEARDVGAGDRPKKVVSFRGPARSPACGGCRSVARGTLRRFSKQADSRGAPGMLVSGRTLTPCRPAGRSPRRRCREEGCCFCEDPTRTPAQIRAHMGGQEKKWRKQQQQQKAAAAAAAAGAAADGGPITPTDGGSKPRARQPTRKMLESYAHGGKRQRHAGQTRPNHKG